MGISASSKISASRDRLELLLLIQQFNNYSPREIIRAPISGHEQELINSLEQDQQELKRIHEKCYIQKHAMEAKVWIDAMLKFRNPETQEFRWGLAEAAFHKLSGSITLWNLTREGPEKKRAREKADREEAENSDKVNMERIAGPEYLKRLKDQERIIEKKRRAITSLEKQKKEREAQDEKYAGQKAKEYAKVGKPQTVKPASQVESSKPKVDPPAPQLAPPRVKIAKTQSSVDLQKDSGTPHQKPLVIRQTTPKPTKGVLKTAAPPEPGSKTHVPGKVPTLPSGIIHNGEAEEILRRSKMPSELRRARDLHSEVKKFTKV